MISWLDSPNTSTGISDVLVVKVRNRKRRSQYITHCSQLSQPPFKPNLFANYNVQFRRMVSVHCNRMWSSNSVLDGQQLEYWAAAPGISQLRSITGNAKFTTLQSHQTKTSTIFSSLGRSMDLYIRYCTKVNPQLTQFTAYRSELRMSDVDAISASLWYIIMLLHVPPQYGHAKI